MKETEATMRECTHRYEAAGNWCAFNFEKECDHVEDPENCEYNIKGVVREEA